MSEVKLDLKATLDSACVGIASRGLLQPPNGEYLSPRLWDVLRQRLQSIFRRATGEPNATLVLLPEGARIIDPDEPISHADGIAWFETTFGVPLGDVPGRIDVERIRALAGKAGEA